MSHRRASLLVVASLVGAVGVHASSSFTPGNLVVVRVGDGAAALSSAATAVFLEEYTPAGAPVQTIVLPTAASGSNRALTNSGTATSEAFLTVSANNQYFVLAGYDAAPGTASVATSVTATINRVVGRIDMLGNVDTSTYFDGLTYSGSNIRSAVSDDGTQFWTGGTASTAANGGCWLVPLGTTAAPTQISVTGTGTLTNMRVVNIFGGQLYVSSASGTFQGVSAIGSGLPTTGGQSVTLLPGFPTAAGPSSYDYFLADSATLYVADDRAITGGGGIQKWTFDGSTWTLAYTLNAGLPGTNGCRGLTGVVDGSVVTLYATVANAASNNSLVTVTDGGAASSFTTLVSAGTNRVFRGVRIVPPAAPPTCPGDVDGDGDVDLEDLTLLLSSFGTCVGEPGYNPSADLVPSGCIDLDDLTTLLSAFGTVCT